MTVGASILACCCTGPSEPCGGLTWAQAPDTLDVAGEWITKGWRRLSSFGQTYQHYAEMAVQFEGTVAKGNQSGWNTGPNTNLLYESTSIVYNWQVTQEVLEGSGTGDSESGSGTEARFRIFCSKTGVGTFGLGTAPIALCDGQQIAEPPYVIGLFTLVPPYPPTTPNGPPIRPSSPWGGVDQNLATSATTFLAWLNTNSASGSLSRFQPEQAAWVSDSITGAYQPARLSVYTPRQVVTSLGSCSATIPTNYDRCQWALDYANLPEGCGWDAWIIETQTVTVGQA